MLIEDKFIYLSLPRCASTSFLITCLRNNINFKHSDEFFLNHTWGEVDLNLDNENLADQLLHGHERIVDLKTKFSSTLPVVGIKRNRHERFLSLWKHFVDLTDNLTHLYDPEVSKILSKLNADDILFYRSEDLVKIDKTEVIDNFIEKNGLTNYINSNNRLHFRTITFITINPLSYFHNNDPNIIWFNYDNLNEFELWVSNTLNRPFKLEKSNSSKNYNTELEISPNFIENYNKIYDYFDLPKTQKSLI
jgi:hypothetical protein